LASLESLSLVLALLLVAAEFTIGVCLLTGVYRKWTTRLTLAFMVVMTPLTLYLALFNPVSDCGCFGDAIKLTNWETFYKNIVLSAASVFLLIHYRQLYSLYSTKTRWIVPVFAFMYTVGFALWNYNHLPLIDFRAYKTGVNIEQAMSIPEGAPQDEYEYSFVYEKDGKQQTFSMDDYPQNDSSWTFVETSAKLIKEGYHPAITDFVVYDEEGNDYTQTLLNTDGDILLLIAPDLAKANDRSIDHIANIYEYCRLNTIPFYCITGSTKEDIETWKKISGAGYPFLEADETLLKTVVRSNPGLLWMQNGTIQVKLHFNDFPQDEEQTADLLAEEYAEPTGNWIPINLAGFILPLLLVWIYDRRRRS
jgi:uncharacterized membrane protein YphA (DoxX/SURF4 family)